MELSKQLIDNYPKDIKKNSPIFEALVANSNSTGVLETILKELKEYSESWTDTPNIYNQSGEMLELSADFFSYFDRYTDETEEAYKERIKTIFIRNHDKIFGTPINILNVFKQYFKFGNVFLIENTGNMEDGSSENLLTDNDFEQKSDDWIGIDEDITSNCHYSENANFNKTIGVEVKSTGTFNRDFENDKSEISPTSGYEVGVGETYDSIAKNFYGNSNLGYYIRQYDTNPETINGPVNATTKVVFSRKYSINKESKIPIGTVVSYQNKKYFTTEEGSIGADDEAKKATVNLYFTIESTLSEDINIPEGTIVSDENGHKFITDKIGKISSGYVLSESIPATALEPGSEYNVAANTITEFVSPIGEYIDSVYNSNAAAGGTNGTNVSSSEITVKAVEYGTEYNLSANTIDTIESDLPEDIIFVNNPYAITNGAYPSNIKIPAFNTYYLHFFMAGKCKIIIKDNRNKYWNPTPEFNRTTGTWTNGKWQDSLYELSFTGTDKGKKASVEVVFTRETSGEEVYIPEGTIVSDGTHQFITNKTIKIADDETESEAVLAIAKDVGKEYNVIADAINTIESELSGFTVSNSNPATGGSDFGWNNFSVPITCDINVDEFNFKIVAEDTSCFDYFRIFKKQQYPTFTVIAQYETFVDNDAAAVFPGNADTDITTAHENASYFDNDYISGVVNTGYATEIYKDILEYVKAVGVKAYVEIINKVGD